MTQDVTEGPILLASSFGANDIGHATPSRQECECVAEFYRSQWVLQSWWYNTIRDLMLAGFCFTLMAGCSLTYKGPQYDLSTLSELRPEPVRHRTTDGMLSQQRNSQRDLLP